MRRSIPPDGGVRLLNLEGLVHAARAGDRTAFQALYERFAPVVHSILLARHPRDATQDLVQDVFVTALEQLHTLREAAAFPGWICAIARRKAVDACRARAAAPQTGLPPRFDAAGTTVPPDVAAAAQHALDAIQHLPEAYRETLLMRLVEGMSGPEIARLTGLTPESVRVNLHRGFKLLRETLGQKP